MYGDGADADCPAPAVDAAPCCSPPEYPPEGPAFPPPCTLFFPASSDAAFWSPPVPSRLVAVRAPITTSMATSATTARSPRLRCGWRPAAAGRSAGGGGEDVTEVCSAPAGTAAATGVVGCVCSAAAVRISSSSRERTSSAVGRSSGFLARQPRIRASRLPLMSAPRSRGGTGVLETCWLAISIGVLPVKGGSPTAAWYSVAPRE